MTMKRIYIIGFAFAAIFAFSIVGASGALAFTLWDECIKIATTLAFQDADCSVAGPPNEWGWEEILTPTEVDSLASKLTLLFSGVTIECEGFMDGTVGAGGNDLVIALLNLNQEEITEAKPITCKVTAGSLLCGSTTAHASPVHLPWKTLLEANGDNLEEDGFGHPGLLVSCPNTTLECARELTYLTVENLPTELEVDLGLKKLEEMICTGGTKMAVEGTVSILLVNGNALRAM